MRPVFPRFRLLLLVALLGATPILQSVGAGTLIGKVEAAPPDAGGKAGEGGAGAYGSRKFKFLEKIDYAELSDFVVHIDRVAMPLPEGKTVVASIAQRDGDFEPHILPVVMGTEVEFTNFDDIYHNVFSMSEACEFDLGLYKKGSGKKSVRFGLPGRVDVFCSIHTKMNCVILVLPNPWFALCDRNGRYEIRNIPAGTYRLRAWHERIPAQVREVVVPEKGEVRIDFLLGPKSPAGT